MRKSIERFMDPICQSRLPVEPWMTSRARRLPGLTPVPIDDWLCIDDVYAAQMAYRDDLLRNKIAAVYAMTDAAVAAAEELLAVLIKELSGAGGYRRSGGDMVRPDGLSISLDGDDALVSAGRLVQEDLVILTRDAGRHRFSGGVVCFPASWTLAEKVGRSLGSLHDPVDPYTDQMNARVERILDNLSVDAPVQRANFLIYTDPDLHQPLPEGVKKNIEKSAPRYVRVERQSLRRLPKTHAIIFAIHTYVVPATTLSQASFDVLAALRPELVSSAV